VQVPTPRNRLEGVLALVSDDMRAVDAEIEARLTSDVALINTLGAYIIGSGGKRLRPMTLLLAARACGATELRIPALLGAVIEFIHTATLLHDDVVDESSMRRGKDSANEVWGNAASVLVGDFLYSRSFQMMVDANSMRVMDLMSETTNAIAEGEVMQLLNANSPDVSEAQYMATIQLKTARLFEAATRLGAIACDAPKEHEEALGSYGKHLGIAFQLVDDALDYTADMDELGKNLGDDLAEGKPTLPVIEALRSGTDSQQQTLRLAIENGDRSAIGAVVEAIESTGALSYTAARAVEEAERAKTALAALPKSEWRDALMDLADFAVERRF